MRLGITPLNVFGLGLRQETADDLRCGASITTLCQDDVASRCSKSILR
jgi:hypothetical protein